MFSTLLLSASMNISPIRRRADALHICLNCAADPKLNGLPFQYVVLEERYAIILNHHRHNGSGLSRACQRSVGSVMDTPEPRVGFFFFLAITPTPKAAASRRS